MALWQTLSYTCAHSAPHWTLTNGLSVWGRKQVSLAVKFALGQAWGARRRAQGPSDDTSRALRPVEVLNTFSLEMTTPQMLQNSQVLLAPKASQGTLVICLLGWGMVAQARSVPQHRNTNPQAGCLHVAAATSTHSLTLWATSILQCCDKEQSGVAVRALDELAPTSCPSLCLEASSEFTPSCWPAGLHRYLIIHPLPHPCWGFLQI